jgi:hypothetical protein
MEKYKTCTKCCQEKSITEFSKDKQRKDGLYPHCKCCSKRKINKWLLINKEKVLEYHKKYNIENKEKRKAYRIKTKNHISLYMKKWRRKNKIKIKNYKKDYHKNIQSKNINYRILHSLRGRLSQALKENIKCKHTLELIGCNITQLKNHLSSQFKDNMNWNNYGRKGWHIDHIKPCASFNLADPNQQKMCFHYTNLQPLWWLDNCKKNKY